MRTTNPVESTFATVRLRTKVTRGAGSRSAARAMTFKLIKSAQERWRSVNPPLTWSRWCAPGAASTVASSSNARRRLQPDTPPRRVSGQLSTRHDDTVTVTDNGHRHPRRAP